MKTEPTINIQDEVAKIHAQYGITEMANYRIEKLFEKYVKQFSPKVKPLEWDVHGPIHFKYPELVTKLTNFCGGWINGSAADPDHDNPRDYDVFIPLKHWQQASSYIPKDAKINRMGGFKCISDGIEVDVWTGLLEDIVTTNHFKYAYQPLTGIRIKRVYYE